MSDALAAAINRLADTQKQILEKLDNIAAPAAHTGPVPSDMYGPLDDSDLEDVDPVWAEQARAARYKLRNDNGVGDTEILQPKTKAFTDDRGTVVDIPEAPESVKKWRRAAWPLLQKYGIEKFGAEEKHWVLGGPLWLHAFLNDASRHTDRLVYQFPLDFRRDMVRDIEECGAPREAMDLGRDILKYGDAQSVEEVQTQGGLKETLIG